MWSGGRIFSDGLRMRLGRALGRTESGRANRTPPSDEYLNYRAELREGWFRLVHEGGTTTVLERTRLPDANPSTVDITLHDSGRSLIAEARDDRDGVISEIRHTWEDPE